MRQSITEAAGMRYVGLDVSDRSLYYAIADEAGATVAEGSVRLTRGALVGELGDLSPARVALEAGTHSRWLAALFQALGCEVRIADPRQIPLITASQKKTDRRDAAMLARLVRVDPELLSPIEHRREETQCDLLWIRARATLVKSRTAMVNSMRGLVKGFGYALPATMSGAALARVFASLPEPVQAPLAGLLRMVAAITKEIEQADEALAELAREHYPETARLAAVPGVGPVTALTFVLTLDRPERFRRSRDVGAFLGLCPRQQQSGESCPQLGITKAGDRYLRSLFVQAAQALLRTRTKDSAIQQWGRKLCGGGGDRRARKRAVIAVARKLAVLLHKLWVTGEEFRPFPVTV